MTLYNRQKSNPVEVDDALIGLLLCIHAAGDAGREAIINAGVCAESRLKEALNAYPGRVDASDGNRAGFLP